MDVLKHKAVLLRARRLHAINLRRPAVALPPEILGDIFLYACLDYLTQFDVYKHHDAVKSFKPPTARYSIASVCYRWRQVAVSTSALWSSIFIHSTALRRVVPRLPLLVLELARSGNRPLDLTIQCSDRFNQQNEMFPIIRAALPRCEKIILRGDQEKWPNDLMSSIDPIPFPNLRSFISESGGRFSEDRIVDFSKAPIVEEVFVDGAMRLVNLSSCRMKRLALHQSGVDLSKLSLSSLEVLALSRCSSDRILFNSSSFNLPELRQLDIRLFCEPFPIVAPKLQYLKLGFADETPVTSGLSSLQTLHFDSNDTSGLIDSLRGVPQLSELYCFCVSPELIVALSRQDDSGAFDLVPDLRKLHMKVRHRLNQTN